MSEKLIYQQCKTGRRSKQKTVKRHYLKWRSEQNPPIPLRCDNPECVFHNSPLIWNGKYIDLILDHKNGVSGDNRCKSLQLLCPNCDSQSPYKGGRNKGRVKQDTGGYAIKKDGKWEHGLPCETVKFTLTGR